MDGPSVYSGVERRMYNSSLVYLGQERRAGWSTRVASDEQNLIQRAIARDRHAFARLYDRFIDRIYRLIYFRVESQSQAEALTSEVFSRIWEALPAYRWSERPFAAWVYRVAQNVLADHAPSSVERVSQSCEPNSSPPTSMTVDELRHVLARLDSDQQTVVILRFMDRYDTDAIAKIMDKSPETVRALQWRALVSLHGILPGR